MINIFSTLNETISPNYCFGCKRVMVVSETGLCSNCLIDLNISFNGFDKNNDLSNKVSIYFPVKNAVSFLNYKKQSLESKLIHRFKYENDIIIGQTLTKIMCKEIEKVDWIRDIDLIIPLPLHWLRELNRGFNQANVIAVEIGKYFDIEVNRKLVKRVRYNKSQTKKTKEQRWKNVENIFRLKDKKQLENKHILIVDDIATTGASLNSCIREICKTNNIKISVIVLGTTDI